MGGEGFLLLLCGCFAAVVCAVPSIPLPLGNASAVSALVERLYPGASSSFIFALDAAACPSAQSCFSISDGSSAGTIHIAGSTASELSAGLGYYLREFVNATWGWPRGGGSRFPRPTSWPPIGRVIVQPRLTPVSWTMNVCTHSYTLLWNNFSQWEQFIDWAALSGINMLYALTGQEEIQYKTLAGFGLDDLTIRSWFNGPAFLTWSRGQNSHGSSIGGPLPRSWMAAQWELQRQILPRLRELAIVGLLPAFQGNVPWPLATALNDSNITRAAAFYGPQDTGWMDSLDPNFGRIADSWMQTLCADFGCDDHFYQMDGFFHNGTSWGVSPLAPSACTWSAAVNDSYLAGCTDGRRSNCSSQPTLEAAFEACEADAGCGGVTLEKGSYQLRAGSKPIPFKEEVSWVCSRARPGPDPAWSARGAAAYEGIARTDRAAVWGWQGWALNVMGRDATLPEIESYLRGFFVGAPQNKFFVIDMDEHGTPAQWSTFNFGDIPFIWTALEDFGGTLSIKGNLSSLDQELPWAAIAANATGLWGVGATPEGLDQNPAVYELLADASFLESPVADRTAALIARAHRRYGLSHIDENVSLAWTALSASSYSINLGVADETGVGLLSPSRDPLFWTNDSLPTPLLCKLWDAWGSLLGAGSMAPSTGLDATGEPFIYDVTDIGREVLSRVSTPLALAFQSNLYADKIDAALLQASAAAYAGLLRAMDALLGADAGFLLGPWLESARQWGQGADDCKESIRGSISCADFYEWNARAQLTTWYPPLNRSSLIARDGDYARKQWSGLVAGYYATRVDALLAVGLNHTGGSVPLSAIDEALAAHAWDWVTSTGPYPTTPEGDPVVLGLITRQRYAGEFVNCGN
jgi:hypothetical protein